MQNTITNSHVVSPLRCVLFNNHYRNHNHILIGYSNDSYTL